jgi:effector-binding domain-containing protein
MAELRAIVSRVPGLPEPEASRAPSGAQTPIKHEPVKALVIHAIFVLQTVLVVDDKELAFHQLLNELAPGVQSAGSICITPLPGTFTPDPSTFVAQVEGADTVAVYDQAHPFIIDDERLTDAVRPSILSAQP